MHKIHIPPQLTNYTQKKSVLIIKGNSLDSVLQNINREYPLFYTQIVDSNNSLRSFVGIFIDGEQVDSDEPKSINKESTIHIIMSIAGG